MKAMRHTQYGPPTVVSLQDIPQPIPKADEVLIRVHASTVNRTDSGFRSAEYVVSRLFSGLLRPKYTVLGSEFAGEVVAVGASVTQFRPGDKVFGYNDETFGGHAEYMVTPAHGAIATLPEGYTYQTAAPICEGAHYALNNIRAANVQPGQHILVYGATGAIGSAAVQLIKQRGAHVTAVCATPNVALVASLGADVVVDYLREDFRQTDQRYDFIFDAVGKSSYGACKPLLKARGVYISTELGKGGENIFLALTTPIFSQKRLLFPIPTIKQEDVLFLKSLVETGAFRPIIDRSYPLADLVAAYQYVETGQKIGNVVIDVVLR